MSKQDKIDWSDPLAVMYTEPKEVEKSEVKEATEHCKYHSLIANSELEQLVAERYRYKEALEAVALYVLKFGPSGNFTGMADILKIVDCALEGLNETK